METPEFFQTGYYNTQFTPEKRLSDAKNSDHFVIEDLLDFPNDETMGAADEGGIEAAMTGTSTDSSTITVAADNSCNSSAEPHFQRGAPDIGGTHGQFSSELCVPYDELAELEWLSNFVEESFSSTEDLQKLQLIQGMKARTTTHEPSQTHHYQFQPGPNRPGSIFRPEITVPAKARSKRSRAPPGNWTSRLLVVSPTPSMSSSTSESDIGMKSVKHAPKKKEVVESGGEGRKCLHCATDKTPQWRTGPMGPKTLCNACGVRYKSGRLVPEYRPAASPTFVQARHSNSHRKVLELRRQKEMVRVQQQQQQQQQFMHHQNMMFDNVNNGDDYLIHQHIGPDYRQII